MSSSGDKYAESIQLTPAPTRHRLPSLKPLHDKGDIHALPHKAFLFVEYCKSLLSPSAVFLCDGTDNEAASIIEPWVSQQIVTRLGHNKSSLHFRTDPRDVGDRPKIQTFFCTSVQSTEHPLQCCAPTTTKGTPTTTATFTNTTKPIDIDTERRRKKKLEDEEKNNANNDELRSNTVYYDNNAAALVDSGADANSKTTSLAEATARFTHSMKGRTMYVIPFCVGEEGSKLCKYGVMVTDSPFVYMTLRTQVRVSDQLWAGMMKLGNCSGKKGHDKFIKCIHSVGCPRPARAFVLEHWYCNPEKAFIAHQPDDLRLKYFGTGLFHPSDLLYPLLVDSLKMDPPAYIVSNFSILSVKAPHGKVYYIAVASVNENEAIELAEMTPALAGYQMKIIACNGLTILWPDYKGYLTAYNPMTGFSGLGNRIKPETCPQLLVSLLNRSLLLNTAHTSDGDYFWPGLENVIADDVLMTNWKGQPHELWEKKKPTTNTKGKPCVPDDADAANKEKDSTPKFVKSASSIATAAHEKCRYFSQYSRYPCCADNWDSVQGFPISAIIYSSKRNQGVPLVRELKSWAHGVLVGACLKSDISKGAKHDLEGPSLPQRTPMAMVDIALPYTVIGKYLDQWLAMEQLLNKPPKVFQVNWSSSGYADPTNSPKTKGTDHQRLLWPGLGDNVRLIDWMLRRCEDYSDITVTSPLGLLPRLETINLSEMDVKVDMIELLAIDKRFWLDEITNDKRYVNKQLAGESVPLALKRLVKQLEAELKAIPSERLDQAVRKECKPPEAGRCITFLGPVINNERILPAPNTCKS